MDGATAPLDDRAPDHLVRLVVTALHQHVGKEGLDQLQGSIFAEETDRVHAAKASHDFRSVFRPVQRSVGTLPEPPYRSVVVHADDKCVTEFPGPFEVLDVTAVNEVEDPVREYHRS